MLLCLSTDFVYSSSFYRRHFSLCLLVLSSSVPTSLFPPPSLLPALTLFGVQSKVRHEVHSSGSSCQLCLLVSDASSSPFSSATQIIAKTVNLLNSPPLTANLLRDLCFMYVFLRFFLLLVPYYFHFARTKHKDSQRQMGKITANAKASYREWERGTITTAK